MNDNNDSFHPSSTYVLCIIQNLNYPFPFIFEGLKIGKRFQVIFKNRVISTVSF